MLVYHFFNDLINSHLIKNISNNINISNSDKIFDIIWINGIISTLNKNK